MLSSVEIKNFQSHKHTQVSFESGTNVIIGMSDAGKSSIFRAINWVLSNRPLGDAYRSEWGGDTHVILTTVEGDVIERVKSPSRNEYIINGKILKAFGSDIPQEIIEVVCMDVANIQTQSDSAFLLSNTPGEAARLLNKAANIDDIDKALSTLLSEQSKINTALKYHTGMLEGEINKLEQYKNLPDIHTLLLKIEENSREIDSTQAYIINLTGVVLQIDKVMDDLEETKHIPDLLKRLNTLMNWYSGCCIKESKMQELKQLVTSIKSINTYLSETTYITAALELWNDINTLYEQRSVLQTHHHNLSSQVDEIQILSKDLKTLDAEIQGLEKQFEQLAPDQCPLCGSEWIGGKYEYERDCFQS
jgi:exonuclease SbcC